MKRWHPKTFKQFSAAIGIMASLIIGILLGILGLLFLEQYQNKQARQALQRARELSNITEHMVLCEPQGDDVVIKLKMLSLDGMHTEQIEIPRAIPGSEVYAQMVPGQRVRFDYQKQRGVGYKGMWAISYLEPKVIANPSEFGPYGLDVERHLPRDLAVKSAAEYAKSINGKQWLVGFCGAERLALVSPETKEYRTLRILRAREGKLDPGYSVFEPYYFLKENQVKQFGFKPQPANYAEYPAAYLKPL